MKNAASLLLALLLCIFAADRLHAQEATTFDADRYTDQGGGNVLFEQGTLFLDGSYVPETSGTFPASQFQLDAATLAQVSGQPVATLNVYEQIANITPGYLDNFARSADTYPINGVPYVIVSVAGLTTTPPTGTPTVSLKVPAGAAALAGTTVKVTFTRTGSTTADLTVHYKVKGSARSGTDYKPLSGMLTIPAGQSSAKLKVKTLNDAADSTPVIKLELLPGADGSYGVDAGASGGKLRIISEVVP